ncbi:MAG: nucleoside 2-deoxyribosyltransferase [Candidatus Doudnabacteria bacterium]|nr:nucleoside 2-deoxyribosyltransferase [Candidatus Doudnabacteria bacterium]
MKIYLASSITQASKALKPVIDELKEKVRAEFELLDFFGLGPGEAKAVFQHNIQQMHNADLVLAECSQPSLGVGFEIGYALSINKPVLAVALSDVSVSRMITGNPHPKYKFQRYQTVDEVITAIKNFKV